MHASSPQGRFADGAAALDGLTLRRTEANGKHLLHHYEGGRILHVHLGLYGKFTTGHGEPPVPVGALRLRLQADSVWADLRGPTACEMFDRLQVKELFARLGPDPLRPTAEPQDAFARIARSRTSIAALLMDQKVIAGIGNVYRAEILYRHRIHPFLPGTALPALIWQGLWTDLVGLMRSGVRTGRIVTVRDEDRPRRRGPLNRTESVYVYRRNGEPCRVCGVEIMTEVVAGRNLFWCPSCQRL